MIHALTRLHLFRYAAFRNGLLVDTSGISHRLGKHRSLFFLSFAWLYLAHIRVRSHYGFTPVFLKYKLLPNAATHTL